MSDGAGSHQTVPRQDRVVADRLRRARRRRFVGREAELELLRGALAAPAASFAVAFVHGPGGVGKSALLRAVEDDARDAGMRAGRVDLRGIEPAPPAFCAALAGPLERSADDVQSGALGDGRCLVLLDTYESAGALDGWLREEFIPSTPAGTVVVIAGRERPAAGWVSDPGWRELLRVVPLRNLPPGDARTLLRAEGVREELHDGLLTLTHGHPLALSLLVDVLAQSGHGDAPPSRLAEAPDAVRTLLERFVAGVPSPTARRALDVCAQARTTTEGLLRDALEVEDAHELFAWLRSLSFVDEGERGLFPHDLARDVLVADARSRDPDAHAVLHQRIHDYMQARIRDVGTDRQQVVGDSVFLHRDNPFTARLWDWSGFGEAYVDDLRPGDREALVAMATEHEGAGSAALVAHWIDRQPSAFIVFRGSRGVVVGFAAMLALHDAGADDLAADPGARAMWAWAQRHAPPRPGEEVHATRFFIDAVAHQGMPSRSLNALTIASTLRWLGRRRPAWEIIGAWLDPDAAAPLMGYIGFERVPDADYEVDGRRLGVYAHDWRRRSPQRWLEMMGRRETAPDFEPAHPRSAPVLALSQEDFTHATRQALRDLHDDDALARNPLAAARVVADRAAGEPPGEVLEALLREAVASLAHHPRKERLQRVLDRTYLRPAPTQERAAELLDLPISTYRRHLARGVAGVADWLWERELYGTSGR